MSVEPNIKNRVTGAIVLVALGVIFLPLILDGQKKNQILESQIPEKPIKGEIILVNVDDIKTDTETNTKTTTKTTNKASETKVIENKTVKEQVVNNQPAKSIDKQKVSTESVAKKDTDKTKPEINKAKPEVVVSKPVEERRNRPNYKAAAYVIQLGSFGNKTNASKLVSKLKNKNYKAYLSNGKSNGKIIYRVLVGPILKRDQAESKISGITKLTGLKPIIVTYDPLKH